MKQLIFLILLPVFLLGAPADHLVFTRVALDPTRAEMVVIHNPTDTEISLDNYYITDATDANSQCFYYNLPDSNYYWSGSVSDFAARFPADSVIPAGGSLTLGTHDADTYYSYYGEYPDLALFGDMRQAIEGHQTISLSDNFSGISNLSNPEVLILFYWDQESVMIQDVDYFQWGSVSESLAIDKTGIWDYLPDTPIAEQFFMGNIGADLIYLRNGAEEDEITSGGNGITGHDETSENFPVNWRVVYSPGKITPISDILNGYVAIEAEVIVQGLVVSFADKRPSNGPQAIVIQDEDGHQLSLIVFGDWDIPSSDKYYLFDPYDPSEYIVQVRGFVDYYEGSAQWQIQGFFADDIIEYQSFHTEGDLQEDPDIGSASIHPAPYVIIPSIGERLDYSYAFPSDSRVIVRIFDASGRTVTTLVDKYYGIGGTVVRAEDKSDWDGRDHLGQIVAPGTYFMHIEASNFSNGKTTTDMAPVVVGVKF